MASNHRRRFGRLEGASVRVAIYHRPGGGLMSHRRDVQLGRTIDAACRARGLGDGARHRRSPMATALPTIAMAVGGALGGQVENPARRATVVM